MNWTEKLWSSPTEKLQLIADSVLRLSDFYIKNPKGETPWNDRYCQLAYRHYYLPLNYLRVSRVIERGHEVGFFDDLDFFIDWGSGPGTAALALTANEKISRQIKKILLFDKSESVFKAFHDLKTPNSENTNRLNLSSVSSGKKACLVFSYSLTELNELPTGYQKFDALMILEPSTQQDGRSLLQLRQRLIENGYYIWAPCTHQLKCPLLTHSKTDWCHDRVKVNAPDWFLNLEMLLPMKNKTVTTSYLLARKTPPFTGIEKYSRLTGDSLEENGKTRQLICRGENREFLTWMHKKISPQVLNRGDLIELPDDFELKSNEIRLNKPI